MKLLKVFISVLCTTFFTNVVFAHAMLESSSPKNGAVLATAPKEIKLEFGHAAKLTSLKLNSSGKDTSLTIDKTAAAGTLFSVPLPALGTGKYTVMWSALSADGHAMTGKIAFTVAAPK